MKQKYEETNKDNKEYAKNLFNALKENSDLKDKSVSDAETLADTLSINQVLMEEIKVKDAIIKANETINSNKDKEAIVVIEEQDDESRTKCTECSWKSTDATKLAGHMNTNAIGWPLVRGPHLSFPFWRPLVWAGSPCGPLSRSGLTR